MEDSNTSDGSACPWHDLEHVSIDQALDRTTSQARENMLPITRKHVTNHTKRPSAAFRQDCRRPSFVLADSASDHLALANASPMSANDLCQQVVLDLAWLVFEVRWVERKTMRVFADSARQTFGAVFVC